MIFGVIHLYGLMIALALMVGIFIIEKATKFFHQQTDWLDKALPWMLVGALIGARVYHLVTDWQLYTGASFWDLIAVWRGGIGFLGGILGGGVGLLIWILVNPNKHPITTRIFTYLDLLVFGVPVAQAIGRLGNYFNQELYGLPTNLPWAITIAGQKYHPLFLYEALANLLLFLVLYLLARKKSLSFGKGQYFSLYIFSYGLIRFWLEYLRVQTARMEGIFGLFSIAQWVCLTLIISGTILFWVRRHAPKKQYDFSLE